MATARKRRSDGGANTTTTATATQPPPPPPPPSQQQQQEDVQEEEDVSSSSGGMTEIERQRLANIRRNAEVLMQAGLGGGHSLLGRRKQPATDSADGGARRKKVGSRGERSVRVFVIYFFSPALFDGDYVDRPRFFNAPFFDSQAAAPLPKKSPQEPTRRSLRNLGKDAPDYREAPDIRVRFC
jgi:hypothetical protein